MTSTTRGFGIPRYKGFCSLITGAQETNSAVWLPLNRGTHRAEAVKIVLEALDEEEIITLPSDISGEPWYEPYMEIAQDLAP